MAYEIETIKAELESFAEKTFDRKYYIYSGDENGLLLNYKRIDSRIAVSGSVRVDLINKRCYYRASFLVRSKLPDILEKQLEAKWTEAPNETFIITQTDSVRNCPYSSTVNTQIVKKLSNEITCSELEFVFDKLINQSVEVFNLCDNPHLNPPDASKGDYVKAVEDALSELGVKAEYTDQDGINPHYSFWCNSEKKFEIAPIQYRIYVDEACLIEAEPPTSIYTRTPEDAIRLCKKVCGIKSDFGKGKTPYWNLDVYPNDNNCRFIFYVSLVTNITKDQLMDAIAFLEDVINRYMPRISDDY